MLILQLPMTPESLSGKSLEGSLSNSSSSKLSADDEHAQESGRTSHSGASDASSVKEIKLEKETTRLTKASPARPASNHDNSQSDAIKKEFNSSAEHHRPSSNSRSEEIRNEAKPESNHVHTSSSVSSLADPLLTNRMTTTAPGQQPPPTSLPSGLPPYLPPTGLSQVPLFDPLFASNSQNLLRQELNNRFLATSQERSADLLNSSPFLRPDPFLMPPLLLNKPFDFGRPPPIGPLSTNPFPPSLSSMVRTSTPNTVVSTNSTLPARSSSALPSASSANTKPSSINVNLTVPPISSSVAANINININTRPSSRSSSSANAGLLALPPPPVQMPGLGLLPNHHLLPPTPQHLASLQQQQPPPSSVVSKTATGQTPANHLSKYKPSGLKPNWLGQNKWSSMHWAIAREIQRFEEIRTGKSNQPEKPFSVEQKSSSSMSNKSRGDPLSINHQQSNGITTSSHSKSIPPPASVTSTLSSSVPPSSLAHLPPHLAALQPLHGLGPLPNAQFPTLPFPVMPNQIDAMKNMNSLFNLPPTGMPPHPSHLTSSLTSPAKSSVSSTPSHTTATSSAGLPSTPMTSSLNRFPLFPGTPTLKSDLLTPPSSTQSALNSNSSLSSPLTNPFLRPPGLFQSPFNLPTPTLPGTSAASIPPSPVLTSALPPVSQPNSTGRLTPSAMFANEMWSRARMFSPLMNPGLGWSPLKPGISADAAQKQLSTSNNSTGKLAKESQSKTSASIKQSPSSLSMNNSLNQPPSSFHPQHQQQQPRPPSRLNLNSSLSQQQKQQQQQQSSKPNYKREHSQSPSGRHTQYPPQTGFNSSALYHPSNKMPKLADSPLLPPKSSTALTPTTSLPSSVMPSMAGFNPSPMTNGFNVPPHHLLPFPNMNNSSMAATNPANRMPMSSSAPMPGIPSLSAAHPPNSHLNSSIAAAASAAAVAAKHKSLENASQLAQTNGLPGNALPHGLLPPSLAGPSPAELALLQGDQLALERAKYLSMMSTLPSAGLPGANPLVNPLLHPRLPSASGLPPGMHPAGLPPGMHPGLVGSSEMQAASDAMKYLNASAAMFPGLPSGFPGLVQPPMLPPDLANPFKSLTDFTRSGFGERELFSRYSILSNAGGGNPLTEKIGKN